MAQLTAFGVQLPCAPPSGGLGAQHALELVMHPPASPPHGTNPGLLGAPPSGTLLTAPVSAASEPAPSPPASPASLVLLPLPLLDEVSPLLLPLPPLEELPPLLLPPPLLDEFDPPFDPTILAPPLLPVFDDVEAGRPPPSGALLGELLLQSATAHGAAITTANPNIHTLLRFMMCSSIQSSRCAGESLALASWLAIADSNRAKRAKIECFVSRDAHLRRVRLQDSNARTTGVPLHRRTVPAAGEEARASRRCRR
jgi:hypothetical protein